VYKKRIYGLWLQLRKFYAQTKKLTAGALAKMLIKDGAGNLLLSGSFDRLI
jgi:hypothetical protein